MTLLRLKKIKKPRGYPRGDGKQSSRLGITLGASRQHALADTAGVFFEIFTE
jgi:hypothetical protein